MSKASKELTTIYRYQTVHIKYIPFEIRPYITTKYELHMYGIVTWIRKRRI